MKTKQIIDAEPPTFPKSKSSLRTTHKIFQDPGLPPKQLLASSPIIRIPLPSRKVSLNLLSTTTAQNTQVLSLKWEEISPINPSSKDAPRP